MKKLKLTNLVKDEINKNQLGKIRGGGKCGCGASCKLTGERGSTRSARHKHPPQLQSYSN